MAKPVISNPCPEKWEEMSPADQGRFCGKCAKIVIDFTKKTTQEILDFLNARKGEDICGKMKMNPISIRVQPRTKIFTAALYLVFGAMLFSACGSSAEHEEPMGKVGIDSAAEAENQVRLDSMMRADSLARVQLATDSLMKEDSAKMMETMNVLDSIMQLKNK